MLIVQKLHDYAGIGEWVKLDLQSIQHRDYFGHLSIFKCYSVRTEKLHTNYKKIISVVLKLATTEYT